MNANHNHWFPRTVSFGTSAQIKDTGTMDDISTQQTFSSKTQEHLCERVKTYYYSKILGSC